MAGNTINVKGSYIDIHDNENVYLTVDKAEVKMGDNGAVSKKKPSKKPKKPQKERQQMTFGKGKGVLDGHVSLLYIKLSGAGWLDGNEADFKRLFSGKNDSCCLAWKGKFGKGTLDYLFRKLIEAGAVTLANGFTRSAIIEGHFKDVKGQWLTGLDKGDKPNAKAVPMIEECISLMRANPDDLLRQMQGDDSRSDAYDPYDHQDLQLHKR